MKGVGCQVWGKGLRVLGVGSRVSSVGWRVCQMRLVDQVSAPAMRAISQQCGLFAVARENDLAPNRQNQISRARGLKLDVKHGVEGAFAWSFRGASSSSL